MGLDRRLIKTARQLENIILTHARDLATARRAVQIEEAQVRSELWRALSSIDIAFFYSFQEIPLRLALPLLKMLCWAKESGIQLQYSNIIVDSIY